MLCCKAQDKCSTLFLSNEKYFSFFVLLEILNIFAPAKRKIVGLTRIGEVLEWLKRHAWKACIPLKGITSSNLVLSAKLDCCDEKKVLQVFSCRAFFI
ncbi:uncharacterized protein BN744_01573 [Bacteroides sp. CAG:633]|nr:uncharacterized protein BN744_01573 [Bacteroides sp. CAG:633]